MTDRSPILIRNPRSGGGERSQLARVLARTRGYEVLDTDRPGQTVELAAKAAERSNTVVACGGDGTLNETVQGVRAAGRLGDVTLGVVPAGTGNDFADNVGIRGIRHAFQVVEAGEERRLDLGIANGRLFLNSCVGGLTADASAATTSERKRRLGVFAYVLTTLSMVQDYEALRLHVTAGPDHDVVWEGEALMLLVGNGRRFPGERMRQANMEDGRLNVVIVEDLPTLDYLSHGAVDRLFRRGADYLTRIKVPTLHVTHSGSPVQFSLDGEMLETNELTVECDPGTMQFLVAPSYDPTPEEWSEPTGR